MNRTLHLATRTKVITFKSALDSSAMAVTAATNVRPLTVDEIRAAAAAYRPPVVEVRATQPSGESIDVTGAPDVLIGHAAKKGSVVAAASRARTPSVRPAAAGAPLPALPVSRAGLSLRAISKQVVFGLAGFGALVAVGSVGVAARMHFGGGVDRVAAAHPADIALHPPAVFAAAPLRIEGVAAPAAAAAPVAEPAAPAAVAEPAAPPESARPRPPRRAAAAPTPATEPATKVAAAAAVATPAVPARRAPVAPVVQAAAPAAPTGNKDLDDAVRATNAANRALESSLH